METMYWVCGVVALWLLCYWSTRWLHRGCIASMGDLPAGEYTTLSLPVYREGNGYVAIVAHANGSVFAVQDQRSLPGGRWQRRYSVLYGYYPQPLPSSD